MDHYTSIKIIQQHRYHTHNVEQNKQKIKVNTE